jgi:primosomal protein N' (replication factor Y) (superfamily II helicase)
VSDTVTGLAPARGETQAGPAARLAALARYATVYPLVTTRALARPFTYELTNGASKGAVVSVPLGRSRRRGVVVELVDRAPDGITPVPIDGVVDQLPPALVDLALWVAEYYGSTPGRALELIAPVKRKRRKEQAPPGGRQQLADEAPAPKLTDEQRGALERIATALDAGGAHFLLYGETGSGKTEVYLQACAAALKRGRTAIVLVPEIALTPQTLGRFRARFGDLVALLHSGLTEAERRDERERIAAGEARVVVGARSAVFAPLPDVGVICVDEEHDPSYKQESDPRYDARTVAAKRASLEGAVAIYGSATPRPESWERLERLVLGGRLGGSLPPVRIVDLRREAGYPLSAPLLAELGKIAENGGKAILLLNRRGVAPALHCRACGTTIRCPECDVALVLHRDERLRCHHCGHAESSPEACPACGSVELARIGAGTQKLERELATRVPELELIRLDADTTQKPEALAAALRRFAETDRAVLLGTQMVAKGHHFAGVSLAAVIDADTGLGVPDFRADERTFQLLTQLAGRSGRDAPGRVLVQTFQPDARPIELAARHDVPRFLQGELDRRRQLGYPPYRHLVRILVTGPELEPAIRALEEVRTGLAGADVLGPAPLFRLRGRYRAQLVAKTDEPRRVARSAGRLLAAAAPAMRRAGLAAVVDVDPQSL